MAAKSVSSAPRSSSDVREIPKGEQSIRAAERRVVEYLRAYGLADEERLSALSGELVAACTPGPDLPSRAVAEAQVRVRVFLKSLFGARAGQVHPLWLRAFVEAYPEHFLAHLEPARAAVTAFGDPFLGELPRQQHFVHQDLRPARWPCWLAGLCPPLLLTAFLTLLLLWDLSRGGLSAAEGLWAVSFAWVFLVPATGLTTAIFGVFVRQPAPPVVPHAGPLPRSALVMPIYHEDPERVFANIAAMRESLAETSGGTCFDVFVLSDSRDLSFAADEERAFRRISSVAGGLRDIPLYYRRRANNERHKPGNLAEFFERFGARYTYVIVLDADSLMTGQTMVELVQRMEGAPRVALMQTALQLRGGQTLLSSAQQLITSLCGPLFVRGLAHWAGPHGNYYGHNAILRVQAFMECCALPCLPGAPPFGGHLLSHDFVEAALLCRAGWEVRTAWDLQGSWEEMPQTFAAFVARERRWCQGNLQHLRIVLAQGLPPMSRIHLLFGALSYLSAPALLVFLALGATIAVAAGGLGLALPTAATLLCAVGLCLGLPRLLALVETSLDSARRRLHGGLVRLLLSLTLETVLSCATAPIMMCHHARTVGSLITGQAVGWHAQQRRAEGSWRAALRLQWPNMALGAAAAVGLPYLDHALWLWLCPCWVPLLLSWPLTLMVSSERLGTWARRLGLFATPCDVEPDPLITRAAELSSLTLGDEAARFRDLVLDPLLLAAHLERLPAASGEASRALLAARERALRMGPAALMPEERALLTNHPDSMRLLHEEAWRRWPVESWQLARTRPQTPLAEGVSISPAGAQRVKTWRSEH